MTALLLQTLMLLVPAFFIGAALACGLRKMMAPAREVAYAPARAQATPVEPLPQYANRSTANVAAPAPQALPPQVATPVSTPVVAKPAAAPAPTNKFDEALRPVEIRPAPPPPPAAPSVARAPIAAPAPSKPAPVATPVATPASAPTTAQSIATAAAAMAAATTAITAQAHSASKPAVQPAPTAAPVAAPAAAPVVADDLTRISLIDGKLNEQLAKLGVTRFKQIAAWRKADVDKVSEALGYQGRIEQENWIEQAQILAGGGETAYSARRAKAAAIPTSAPKVEERAAFGQPRIAEPSTAPAAKPVVAPPVAAPVQSVAKPGLPVPPDRIAVQPAPAAPPSVTKEVMSAAAAAAAAAAAVATQVVQPVAAKVATPSAAPPPPAATSVKPSMAPARDTLQRIGSITPELEKLLASQGVTRFTQIASWGPTEIERYDRLIGTQGRIARENWVEQAQVLAKGGDTAHSRAYDRRMSNEPPPAPTQRDAHVAPVAPAVPPVAPAAGTPAQSVRPKSITEAIKANTGAATAAGTASRPDIGGLRSVRSEAYRPATDAATAAAAAAAASSGSAKVVRSAEVDDLKRVRGIGVLIEKRLNSIGIVNYAQIAEWTNEDIDRVSATLDFKGRIERENWVEQARILASGGQTEFSRRVDRGEVETSKSRPS